VLFNKIFVAIRVCRWLIKVCVGNMDNFTSRESPGKGPKPVTTTSRYWRDVSCQSGCRQWRCVVTTGGRRAWRGGPVRAGDDGDSGVNWSYHVATSKRRLAHVTSSRDQLARSTSSSSRFIYVTCSDQPDLSRPLLHSRRKTRRQIVH